MRRAMNKMIVEVLAVGLLITAFLAIDLDDSIYAIISLGLVLILSSLLYLLNDAYFAALFQFAVGVGTIVVLLIVSETLDEQVPEKKESKKPVGTIIAAVLISIPVLFFTIPIIRIIPEPTTTFAFDLWDFRSIDVMLQGIVILVLAIGMIILLRSEKEGNQ
jgi:NADH:ubiquinone oxidoreductase subunit 6 (subunit J)